MGSSTQPVSAWLQFYKFSLGWDPSSLEVIIQKKVKSLFHQHRRSLNKVCSCLLFVLCEKIRFSRFSWGHRHQIPWATTHRHPPIPPGEKKRMRRGSLGSKQLARKKTAGEWGKSYGSSIAQHPPPKNLIRRWHHRVGNMKNFYFYKNDKSTFIYFYLLGFNYAFTSSTI